MTYLQLFTVEYTSFSYNIVTLLIHLSNGIQNSYKLYLINFLVRFFMTISGSQASAHAVSVNSDRRTGTRIGISKPVHGKDPEGIGVCACLSCGDSVEDQLGVGVSLHHLNRFVVETLNWHFVISLSLVPSDLGSRLSMDADVQLHPLLCLCCHVCPM